MTPRFPIAFLLTQMDKIPTDFHRQVLWGLLFLTLALQAGKTIVGLVSFHPPPIMKQKGSQTKLKCPNHEVCTYL